MVPPPPAETTVFTMEPSPRTSWRHREDHGRVIEAGGEKGGEGEGQGLQGAPSVDEGSSGGGGWENLNLFFSTARGECRLERGF